MSLLVGPELCKQTEIAISRDSALWAFGAFTEPLRETRGSFVEGQRPCASAKPSQVKSSESAFTWVLIRAPRRRSLRSLGSEREPATLRSHRPRCAGSATLEHPNRRRYRWVCPATPP